MTSSPISGFRWLALFSFDEVDGGDDADVDGGDGGDQEDVVEGKVW